jgi:hypothetical protein
MSNRKDSVIEVSDWAVLKVLSHQKRREMIRLCWEKPQSVEELANTMSANPGTVLYHIRRLESVGLLQLVETNKRRGVVEKRYKSVASSVDVRPPSTGMDEQAVSPVITLIHGAVNSIAPLRVDGEWMPIASHVSDIRIGPEQIKEVSLRLSRLRHYVDQLPDDPNGVPMTLAAIFGPTINGRGARRKKRE